jgi:hypothetical protein
VQIEAGLQEQAGCRHPVLATGMGMEPEPGQGQGQEQGQSQVQGQEQEQQGQVQVQGQGQGQGWRKVTGRRQLSSRPFGLPPKQSPTQNPD